MHPRKLARAASHPIIELELHARQSWLVKQRGEITAKIRTDVNWCDPNVAAWWVWGISQWIGGGWCSTSNPSNQRPGLDGLGVHRLSYRGTGAEGKAVNGGNQSLPEHYLKLAARLKHVHVLSGDWKRLVTPAVTTRLGVTGVFLDPPYTKESGRKEGLYANDDLTVGHQVRDWAVKNGDNPKLRIALCGYEEEYDMPLGWSVLDWKALGGKNGDKERIWFSPHCLK